MKSIYLRMRGAVRHALVGGFVLPVALAVAEAFTRLLFPQDLDSGLAILKADPEVSFVYEPGAVGREVAREYNVEFRINSLGLRDREYGEKKEGTFRVLFIGDSFSVGHGVKAEESLPKALEWALEQETAKSSGGRRIEVINAANAGYTPFNYWKGYRRWKAQLDPDMVVVGFSLNNDYACEGADLRFVIRNGAVVGRYREGETPPEPSGGMGKRLRKLLGSHSQFYILVRNFAYYNDRVRALVERDGDERKHAPQWLKPYLVPESAEVVAGWTNAFQLLARLQEETERDGVPLAIVAIPGKLQVSAESYGQVTERYRLMPESIDPNLPFRRLQGFCDVRGIPLLDPVSALRDRHAATACYFRYDDHWNPEGIAVAARSIAARWRESALAPFKNAIGSGGEPHPPGSGQ